MKYKHRFNTIGGNRAALAALLILTMVLVLVGCGTGGQETAQVVEKQDFLLNTVCNIKLQEWEGTYEEGEALARDAFSLARDLENKLSRTVEGSDIWKINQAEGERVQIDDARTIGLLRLAKKYCEMSEGRFDITVGKLSALWNFSSGDNIVPDAGEIQAVLPYVGYDNLTLIGLETPAGNALSVWLTPETHLDLGAIAKGYIVDQVREFLKENGVTRGIVDFGGNIACIGEKPDGSPWLIGIKKPVSSSDVSTGQNTMLGIVSVKPDGTAVTSGTYERKFEQDGVLYHHILDPATGYPCETDVASVTVVSTLDSADCDALSTMCLLYGLDDGLELIESLDGVEAVFVTDSGEVHCSSGAEFEAL
ncbi:MAG: FAD:protein FMN transferase [Firmicutes bacterium]|nr:FAD:protein FMN transferase [Bacillota bacterium]